MNEKILKFWGKTGRDGAWHSAVHHMADVGCVCEALVAERLPRRLVLRLCEPFGLDAARASRWFGFLSALHDIGKIAPGFQCKNAQNQPSAEGLDYKVSDKF